jgi:hypothetical protein
MQFFHLVAGGGVFLEFKFCQKFKVQKIDVMQNGNSFSREKLLLVAR